MVVENRVSLPQDKPTKWELYDMDADRNRTQRLGHRESTKLAELTKKWQAWADRVGVQAMAIPEQTVTRRDQPNQSTLVDASTGDCKVIFFNADSDAIANLPASVGHAVRDDR